jgi:tetratricopeptide (TPR) repeat protein
MAIWEKSLGPEHPNVARSLNGLGSLYETQGDYAKAEPLFKRSLAIKEKALGTDHHSVATSLENLADLYRATNRVAEAATLEARAIKIRATKN